MNQEEKKVIDRLVEVINNLSRESQKFKESVDSRVEDLSDKIEKRRAPVNYEQEILRVAQQSINESISKVLTGYDSPLTKLIKSVVDENSQELRQIISYSFKQVINTSEFKQSIVSAFSHKVARTIINNNDGLFDKVSNELKQDKIFKAKMSLAVSNVVEKCLNNRD